MSETPKKSKPSAKDASREDRLASQLRANLQRRKAQAKARQDDQDQKED